MPKRIPTPPPADDEPRYLTVVYPYAISGTCNMELPQDRQDFACWVACCIDKDAFFAIFHKPSARGMVIIEVNRDYAHFDRILGEHRWSEFLREPTEEDQGRVTQVFYCTYSTGRIVQKNGWKRIDVDEGWYKNWSPRNKYINFPYPATHFCEVPVEDRTNHSLCRPLPGAVVTLPPVTIAAPLPVVGSAAWTQKKEGAPSPITQTQSNSLGAWGKGAPKMQATSAKPNPTANGSVKTVCVPQGSRTSTRMPAIGGGPTAVKATNVWQSTNTNTNTKPVPVPVATNWDDAPISRQSTPVSPAISPAVAHQPFATSSGPPARSNAWGSSATFDPTHPPGLPLPSKITTSVVQGDPSRAAPFSATSWDSTGASTSSPDSDSGPDLTTATESDNPYSVHIHFSESMEEEFHGMGIRAMEDEGELGELDAIAPGAWNEPTAPAVWEATDGAGWDNEAVDAEDHWVRSQEGAKPALCNAHGTLCKKGICAVYAKQVRLSKRAAETESRRGVGANKGKKGGRAKNRDAGKNEANEPSDKNKTQDNNNPFRGPGAPVKTNWRGAPRAIVSADSIEKRETTKAADDNWGNSDDEFGPNASEIVPAGAADPTSDAGWGVSENAYDPWATPAQPVTKEKGSGGKPRGGAKPPRPTKVTSNSWADQVEAELAGGGGADGFSVVSAKHRSKRSASTTSWGTSAAKSSTSGWGGN